uniref:SAUR family protein n=1 Tax=Quercus lobata TaxID=97700 RepID=A0A7N2KSR7_QUELO
MSAGLGKCSKIRHIVRLRQMLRRWRNKARLSANRIPSDVPAGHVAVCVGSSCRRFVVRATHLNHPIFKKLLVQAEEEYGFNNQGPLAIPCDESLFEEVLRFISRSESGKNGNNPTRFVNLEDFQRYCHVGIRNNLDFWPESRPLLHGIADKTICKGKKVNDTVIGSGESYGDGKMGGRVIHRVVPGSDRSGGQKIY